MLWGIVCYVVALGALAFMLKRYAPRISGLEQRSLGRVLQVIQVGPKQRLCVLEYQGLEMLLAVTEHSICILEPSKKERQAQ